MIHCQAFFTNYTVPIILGCTEPNTDGTCILSSLLSNQYPDRDIDYDYNCMSLCPHRKIEYRYPGLSRIITYSILTVGSVRYHDQEPGYSAPFCFIPQVCINLGKAFIGWPIIHEIYNYLFHSIEVPGG